MTVQRWALSRLGRSWPRAKGQGRKPAEAVSVGIARPPGNQEPNDTPTRLIVSGRTCGTAPRGATTCARGRAVFGSMLVYARRMATRPIDDWPEALILLCDQLYAGRTDPGVETSLAGRRTRPKRGKRPPDEVVSFAEYERI